MLKEDRIYGDLTFSIASRMWLDSENELPGSPYTCIYTNFVLNNLSTTEDNTERKLGGKTGFAFKQIQKQNNFKY